MVEWTIAREYGTGIFKAECKERNIVIHKNTYDEARVAMLETLVYTGTLSDADITAIITEVTEDVLAQCNVYSETYHLQYRGYLLMYGLELTERAFKRCEL